MQYACVSTSIYSYISKRRWKKMEKKEREIEIAREE